MSERKSFYIENDALWFHVDDPEDPMDPLLKARRRDLSELVWALLVSHPKIRQDADLDHALGADTAPAPLRKIAEARVRAVEGLPDAWDKESGEWYYENRHERGTEYACGFEDGWGHAAGLLRAAFMVTEQSRADA